MIGQTISHYHILEKLGEGGMGVVYKAEDTKLKRTVALKFLSRGLETHEPERARFLQEAQAAAALNHANICMIYDISQERDPEGADEHFIVMEYVDGQTVRQKLETGNLKLETILSYAVQIGEALQEAHSKGIVHRDVKTDNIMVNSKNQVKVMDFGLAKLKGSLKLTKTSSTVGTLAYMAPEQIQGGEVDARSDIFSFGVVLYEMLTGHMPFRGEHEAAMVYSIVNEEPTPIQKYLPDVSSELVHILNRALEKDPEDRYQFVHEMVIDLRRLKKQTSRVSRLVPAMEPPGGVSESTRKPPESLLRPSKKLWLALAAMVLVIAVVGVLLLRKGAPQLNPKMTFRTIQVPFTEFQYPGLSQNGDYIVFHAADANGKWDLYWMHNSGGDARRVTFDSSAPPPGRMLQADISPDGSQIAYSRLGAINAWPEICVVSSNGGIGRRIVRLGGSPHWRPDGNRIGYLTATESLKSAVFSVKPDGTDDRVEFVDSLGATGLEGNSSFAWSPDGRSIAWIRTFPNATAELIVHNLQSGEEKQLTHDGKNLDEVYWTPQNMIIFSSSKAGNMNLWCIPADGGEELQITKGSGPDLGMKGSSDGRKLLYYEDRVTGNIWYANGEAANSRQLTFDDQYITSPCYSPDSRKIVFSMAGEHQGFIASPSHIYIMDRDGNNRRQLTFGDEVALNPSFSPEGKQLAYRSRRASGPDDSWRINVIDVSGSGTPRTLRPGLFAWWKNETELIVHDPTSSWKVSLHGGADTKVLEDSTFAYPVEGGKFTPFLDLRQSSRGLWVAEDGSKEARQLIRVDKWLWCRIAPRARFAYFVGSDRAIWKVHLPDGRREKLPGTLPGVVTAQNVSFSLDGKEIVFIKWKSRAKLVMIDNLFK